jgi:non-ribosomal peptide synthetase component F
MGQDGLQGSFTYSLDCSSEFHRTHGGSFPAVGFEQAMGAPDRDLSTFSLLDEAEYRQVVEEWNETGVALPEGSMQRLFEEQAAERPDAIAVEFEEEHLSYGELNRRGNRLAQQLQGEGVGPEVFVGVMVERSAEMIVGLLG